jgi:hypothetical protein
MISSCYVYEVSQCTKHSATCFAAAHASVSVQVFKRWQHSLPTIFNKVVTGRLGADS